VSNPLVNAGMNPLSSKSAADRLNSAIADSIVIEIANRQTTLPVDEARLREGIFAVMTGEGMKRANISLAVVDDTTIQELNQRFLKHDQPTDVLSFVLEQGPGFVEGEIIVSMETAAQSAQQFGWSPAEELLLCVIHGALHLAGYDDQSEVAAKTMRQREQFYLNKFGLRPRYEERRP